MAEGNGAVETYQRTTVANIADAIHHIAEWLKDKVGGVPVLA